MTEPNGFWESGTAGQEEFEEDLMNACLVQVDTKTNLDLLTDRAGMFAHSSDDKRFWRSDGADLINLAVIEFGLDAVKPTASAANNGRVFWATDTLTLYIVLNATQYLVSDQNVVIDHVAVADPHTQYQKESEKSAANGYPSLDAGTLLPLAELTEHPAVHVNTGTNQIDGDKLDIDFTPLVYVPDSSPPEATDTDDLTAHLKGIDNALGVRGVKREAITSTGTFTKHANALLVKVILIGAGGGGRATANGGNTGGPGGGGGEYVEKWFNPNDLVAVEDVIIGSGGAGGTNPDDDGDNGGDTTFGDVTMLLASGGKGGNETPSGDGGGHSQGSITDNIESVAQQRGEAGNTVRRHTENGGGGGGHSGSSGGTSGGDTQRGGGGGAEGGRQTADQSGGIGGDTGEESNGGTSGAGGGPNPGGNGVVSSHEVGGGGGGGGGGNDGGNGGDGGNGAVPGGGGGGSGDGSGTSGEGGNGANGIAYIYTIVGKDV